MKVFIPVLLLMSLTACTPWLGRGEFALVSSQAQLQNNYEQVGTEPISGEGCFTGRQADDLIFSWAVEDALSKPEAEGASVLLYATYTGHVEDKGSCITVTGFPARLK
ncbi:MAG: hypothetical protein ACR2QG_12420 [Gammaproteobacteria bacterium]